MIRYAVTFPGEVPPRMLAEIREQLAAIAGARQWIDVVIANGGTITRVDIRPRKTNRHRHAQSLVR